jgi:muramoyltetrapeptide carboxypeptidase
MVRDDSVDVICTTQGGYGAAQILKYIDFDVFKANPKIFTGFSDITSLHLSLYKNTGVVTFHAPGFVRFNNKDLTEYTNKQFFAAVSESKPIGNIGLADKKKWLFSLTSGAVEAPILGGNITLMCATLGTPYEIDTKGKILLIEDVETEPWIVDNALSHLKNAGKFDDVAGIIIGEAQRIEPFKYDPGYYVDTSFEDVLVYYFSDAKVPVLYGLPLGHTDDMATVPEGVMARLDADNKTLTILESGVV